MADSGGSALETSIVMLRRPVIRVALKRGIAHGQFAELVKQAFVKTAQSDFSVPGGRPSVPRTAVVTGLTRKEASRLNQAEVSPPKKGTRRRINRDGRGGPASLPFVTESGPSFPR